MALVLAQPHNHRVIRGSHSVVVDGEDYRITISHTWLQSSRLKASPPFIANDHHTSYQVGWGGLFAAA